MTSRFCPDCGAEVPNESNRCLECHFPLTLDTVAGVNGVRIPPNQKESWKRISTMLRRSGVIVQQRAASETSNNKAWWALPVFGMLFFFATLVMGPNIVDGIWQPPTQTLSPVVDLSQPSSGPPTQVAGGSNSTPQQTGESGDGDVNADFLINALRSSDEQRRRTEETLQEAEAFFRQQQASESQMREYAQQALMSVRIQDTTYYGSLLNSRGMLLVDRLHLTDAFEFERRMKVTASGGVEQVNEYIRPMVGQLGGERFASDREFESERAGVALLRSDQRSTLSYKVDFDNNLSQGQELWVASVDSGNLSLVQTRVTGSTSQGSGILFWTIDTDFGVNWNGLPVFNEFGALTGVLFHMSGGDTVLSLRQLREKEPQLFQKVL
jgi:hypothetical protein